MGQANKRGSYEERRFQAIEAKRLNRLARKKILDNEQQVRLKKQQEEWDALPDDEKEFRNPPTGRRKYPSMQTIALIAMAMGGRF